MNFSGTLKSVICRYGTAGSAPADNTSDRDDAGKVILAQFAWLIAALDGQWLTDWPAEPWEGATCGLIPCQGMNTDGLYAAQPLNKRLLPRCPAASSSRATLYVLNLTGLPRHRGHLPRLCMPEVLQQSAGATKTSPVAACYPSPPT